MAWLEGQAGEILLQRAMSFHQEGQWDVRSRSAWITSRMAGSKDCSMQRSVTPRESKVVDHGMCANSSGSRLECSVEFRVALDLDVERGSRNTAHHGMFIHGAPPLRASVGLYVASAILLREVRMFQ
jgi:hypothetical protein